ncbi:MAG: hypothetical protein ACOC4H_00455, partial [bacterium]
FNAVPSPPWDDETQSEPVEWCIHISRTVVDGAVVSASPCSAVAVGVGVAVNAGVNTCVDVNVSVGVNVNEDDNSGCAGLFFGEHEKR